ncbi:MAG: S9 family peptidase, partial [Halorubrum sp.]
QFLTTRGIAVLDVNYRGSTGYGRAYRDALNGEWGVRDTLDCVNAARHAAAEGLADPDRLAISGGSAGGYAVLSALAFHDTFDAGASYYGVADLAALAAETHKFESRYLDGLVGPLPEAEDTYRERSPVYHAEGITAPLLLLQGGKDEVVPPAQAEAMIDALVENRTPYAYVEFPEERHGFRDADNIARAHEAEFGFYGDAFGFEPAGDITGVELLVGEQPPELESGDGAEGDQ